MFLYILADLISFLEIQRLRLAGSSSTVFCSEFNFFNVFSSARGSLCGEMEKLYDPGNPRKSRTGFHSVDFGFHGLDLRIPCQWNLDSEFQSLVEFHITDSFKPSIPDSPTTKISRNPDSL